jgi:YVTN family beta-propeller protein
VPSNQLISPAGTQIYLPGGRPVGLVTLDNGYLLIKDIRSLDLVNLNDRKVQTLPYPQGGASFNGLCLSPDGQTVYLTLAEDRVLVAHIAGKQEIGWGSPIVLPKPLIGGDPAPGGLAVTPSGDRLLVTLSRNNTLASVNLRDSAITEIPVGNVPFGVIILSESKAYVSNWGGRQPLSGEATYNSSGTPILVNPTNGVASSGSLSVIDLHSGKVIKEITVGLHPSSMALSPDRAVLYVACANSDEVSVINTGADTLITEIPVRRESDTLFGRAPNALCVSPDGKRLYVADGTENALCVLEAQPPYSILGRIPTGWYPGSVACNAQGDTLYVANIKGVGSRYKRPGRKGLGTHDYLGSLSIIPTPTATALDADTKEVERNNGIDPGARATSHFKHIVYIIKENRVYDQVLGDLPQGNGDTSLVLFGRTVTPNHHKLAEEFVLLDNFYTSGVLSADGHQWTDEAYATDYLEKSFGGFARSYPFDGDDPMAYAPSGFIWDNVLKHGLSFRDYGEFVKATVTPPNSTFTEIYRQYKTGRIKISGSPNIATIGPYLCPRYIGFPNVVPDAYRADVFIDELHHFEAVDSFPNFVVMLLPCDHTSGTTPGMPTTRAALADNDLALGRIVEALSHSQFWPETCIFVTEDDSQDGLDHVDGHRTIGFVISPYTRRHTVVSTYFSQVSMVRTMESILGLPPMNRLDAASGDMSACFTETRDLTPYVADSNNIPLDQLNPPLQALKGKPLYWARQSMKQDLSDVDKVDEKVFNRIIWYSVKGYNTPYNEKN